MNNQVLQAIEDRRSIRAYTGEQVSREQLDLLLSAAQASPSARNSQPWHFSVVENQALIEKVNRASLDELMKDLDEKARERMSQPGFTIFHGAPVVIFISADFNGRYAVLDCGIAVENIALAAHSLGLGSVILGLPMAAFTGPCKEELERELCFPQGTSFQIAIAIGHPAATKEKHPVGEGKVTFVP